MAQASAASEKKAKPKSGGMVGKMSSIIVILAALVFFPTTLLLAAGMLPTLVAAISERDSSRAAPLTVGPANLCGVMPYLLPLWLKDHSLAAVTELLRDPLTWLVMYGAAAVGWVIYYAVPPLVATIVMARIQGRIRDLETANEELVEQWGRAVAGENEEEAA
jgi:hypothetical protein